MPHVAHPAPGACSGPPTDYEPPLGVGFEGAEQGPVQSAVQQLLASQVVAQAAAPAASAVVARYQPQAGRWFWTHAARGSRSPSDSTEATCWTRFDLASLTKPVFAVSLARRLGAQGRGLEIELAQALPTLKGSPSGRATLAQLLSHRAGLVAHVELFAPLRDTGHFDAGQALQQAAASRRPECPGPIPVAGFPALYSDLGFVLAGAAAPALCGTPVEVLIDEEVNAPLRLELSSARRGAQRGWQRSDFAPAETVAWRGGEIVGVVHDDNCWALAGLGCAGHAGLFGTARDVASFACAAVDALHGRAEAWLPQQIAHALTATRPGGPQRTGFDGISEVGSSAGPRFSSSAVGHLGFTGTSFWCDPEQGIVVVLLTNRICPTRSNLLLRQLRPALHSALFDCAWALGR